MNILIVEDDSLTADSLGELLVTRGHKVRKAGSSEQALWNLEVFQPDIVIADLYLPGEGGKVLVNKLLSETNKGFRILVLTAALDDDLEGLPYSERVVVLRKPQSPDNIIEEIEGTTI